MPGTQAATRAVVRGGRRNTNFAAVSAQLTFALVLFASGPVIALDPSQRLSQYGHTAWHVRDGWLPSTPETIAHGADGYLWIGLTAGLYRFDGVRFAPWVSEHGERLASNFVTALLVARDGSLWIGTDGGVDRLRDGRLTRVADIRGPVTRLEEASDGTIWVIRAGGVLFEDGLCRIKDERVECPARIEGLDLSTNHCCAWGFLRRADGSLWLGGDLGITRWKDGSTSVIRPQALKSNDGMAGVVGIVETKSGEIWIGQGVSGHEGGLQRFADGKLQALISDGLDTSTLQIQTMYLDSHDAIWIGTIDQGLLRIRGNRIERLRSSDGLTSDTVLRILEDREGNTWAATTNGLDRLRELNVLNYTTREGLTSNETDGVVARRDGSVWIGTVAGVHVLRDGEITRSRLPSPLRDRQISSMFEDIDGHLWIGAEQTMWRLESSGKLEALRDDEGRPPGLVLGMTQDTDRNLWLQVRDKSRRLLRAEGTRIREEFPESRLPAARKVAAAPDGGIWLGTVAGDLVHYREGRTQTFSFAKVNPDFKERRVSQLLVQDGGAVLAATQYGIVEVDAGKQRSLTMANGLPCERAFGLVNDLSGALWLHLECGIARITAEELSAWRATPSRKVRWRLFDALDGARPAWAPFTHEAARSTDGKLWFASVNGLQMIDPARIGERGEAPTVHIETVLADRTRHNVSSDIRLPPLTREVQIEYTAPTMSMPQKITFRYWLEGHDETWSEVGGRRQAFFNDLPPGEYRFQVTACTASGLCNEKGANVTFFVEPAYYQTVWFKMLAVLALIAGLWGIFALRVRQVSARLRTRLEASIAERERIARELHDTFLQSLQGLMLKTQCAIDTIPAGAPARVLMDEALERADSVLAEGRDRVVALRRTGGESRDLVTAVRALADHANADGGGRVRVTVEGEPRALHPDVADETHRILGEGLTNALRHSSASEIRVEIVYARREFVARVIDDGRGFAVDTQEAATADGHWGLAGIRERARKIRARLEIASRPNVGTRIELRVPAKLAFDRKR
jgi:signal transduction histidine kinase/ligand-binding sensor domain-containing protein